MDITRRKFLAGAGALLALGAVGIPPVRRAFHPVILAMRGKKTVADRLDYFKEAKARLTARFASAGVPYPPAKVILLGLKQERRLEIYAGDRELRRIADFPIQAASGTLGPKLREGDRQVPEGVYAVESLNPNSRFHAAIRVGYPNETDRALATPETQTKLGGDIMIHGGSASIGCLAMGDPAAEELFVLVADAEMERVTIVLSPVDLRASDLPTELKQSSMQRYDAIRKIFQTLPR